MKERGGKSRLIPLLFVVAPLSFLSADARADYSQFSSYPTNSVHERSPINSEPYPAYALGLIAIAAGATQIYRSVRENGLPFEMIRNPFDSRED